MASYRVVTWVCWEGNWYCYHLGLEEPCFCGPLCAGVDTGWTCGRISCYTRAEDTHTASRKSPVVGAVESRPENFPSSRACWTIANTAEKGQDVNSMRPGLLKNKLLAHVEPNEAQYEYKIWTYVMLKTFNVWSTQCSMERLSDVQTFKVLKCARSHSINTLYPSLSKAILLWPFWHSIGGLKIGDLGWGSGNW